MECRFLYPDGQRCRCRATTSHVFCRQHAPQPRVPTLRNRAVPFRRWLDLRRALPTLDPAEIPPAILYVLSLLLEENPSRISDRNAGELLRALVRRCGSVPFTLPGDPAPEPDPAYALSQSMDRITAIIRRHCDLAAAHLSQLPAQLIARIEPGSATRNTPRLTWRFPGRPPGETSSIGGKAAP